MIYSQSAHFSASKASFQKNGGPTSTRSVAAPCNDRNVSLCSILFCILMICNVTRAEQGLRREVDGYRCVTNTPEPPLKCICWQYPVQQDGMRCDTRRCHRVRTFLRECDLTVTGPRGSRTQASVLLSPGGWAYKKQCIPRPCD